ncbi:MAG TPA: plastocyanin/azurin family copper-binding protein [Gemmatimonadaceae bacterium]|nr:plastocyanin/azurin family copper-binding protein [Gemmatimonadaceae bacterium]
MTVPFRHSRASVARAVALATTLLHATAAAAVAQGQRPQESAVAAKEAEYYRISTVAVPEGVVLEVGGLETMPDGRLAVATRRGDVWLIENPAGTGGGRPHFSRFAQGLHEALGLAYRDGSLYTTQRSELTRLRDTDGDGRADVYETVQAWPLSGNYHEYSFGPVFSPKGDMTVSLNLAWVGYGESFVKWRGWMLQGMPSAKLAPFATGFRSPSSFGYNLDGDLFYSENQGDWVGSGHITHVERGDFVGNPKGLKWTGDPESPVKLTVSDIPDTGEPKYEVAKRVAKLKTPAVWFPHTVMGISTSAILVDSTRGAFGPFAGQLFVGDQGHSKIMRVALEKVNGVYQGAVFGFREGFMSGVFRQVWGTDGSMYVGQTSRGWGATGRAQWGLQRLVWTGKTPFEPHHVSARPDGFEVFFTAPVDRAAAERLASWGVTSFTYRYHHIYGSPVINQTTHAVRAAVVARDGRSVRLALDSLRQGYVHEIRMNGVRSTAGAALLHDVGYYTVNQIPRGQALAVSPSARVASPAPSGATGPVYTGSGTAVGRAPGRALAKHQTTMPAEWNGTVDQTVSVQGVEGLKFSLAAFDVKAGARVKLDFSNVSDMLHNLVVVRPGTAIKVGEEAMRMGLDGAKLAYVPRSEDVLYHTAMLEPQKSETIYFVAPTTPGEYTYVCTFPGHYLVMQGTMRVGR